MLRRSYHQILLTFVWSPPNLIWEVTHGPVTLWQCCLISIWFHAQKKYSRRYHETIVVSSISETRPRPKALSPHFLSGGPLYLLAIKLNLAPHMSQSKNPKPHQGFEWVEKIPGHLIWSKFIYMVIRVGKPEHISFCSVQPTDTPCSF